jgi:uncharacterized membrane protein YkvA (DUF1232 family)
MTQTERHAKRFAEWTEQLPADVQATYDMLTNEAMASQGRRFLAAALSYGLTQLDLIPDHEKAGAIDDAFVLRIAYGLAAEHAAKVGTKDAALIARLTNEEEVIKRFLGDTTYAKLRRFVIEQADKEVRGRTTDRILSDSRARADLKRELDIAVKRIKPAQVADDAAAEALEVSVKSYLKMKLGG